MRHLPSMRDLLAFEAIARHLSVAHAAEELCLSPSAVSNQLRAIEKFLGVNLFHRTTRTMRLTDAGYSYLQLVSAGLDRIATATQDVIDGGFTDVLTVQCAPSFAPAWLVPRLSSFVSRNPDIDLRIRASSDPVDLFRSVVDVEIRYCLGDTSGLVVEPLLEEAIIPLATPGLARALRGKSPTEALNSTMLIHSERSSITWTSWLRSHHITGVNVARGLRFDRAYLSLQAATDGFGIALESTIFAERAIKKKQLVPLFLSLPEPMNMMHYLVFSVANSRSPKVRKFRDWMLSMAADRKKNSVEASY